jgi:Zn-dependent M28 family amino/carboxypeptidase
VIVLGAHMDSVAIGTGADDNASGVAALLVTADVLAGVDTTRPITFVAFGAEENSLRGSRHFVSSLPEDEIDNILVMLNMDSVAIGDYFYVYAGAITDSYSFTDGYIPGPTWARDLALEVGAAQGHVIRTSPPEGWNGFVGPWSDHYPFAERGVPVVYFERWNWDAGTDPAWGQQTATDGEFMHTARDVFENVDPARIEPVAETLAALVTMLATGEANPPG